MAATETYIGSLLPNPSRVDCKKDNDAQGLDAPHIDLRLPIPFPATPMRLIHAVLVIADISGYTDFIVKREISLLHAEQIITDLLEAMIGSAEHPLVLNKLEGDAAFLYSETGPVPDAAIADAMAQVARLFDAFAATQATLSDARSGCDCGACTAIATLRLKVFVHAGDVALKQVRQFEELAGEPVIVVHRLMKNSVEGNEYVLLSDAIVRAWPPARHLGRDHRDAFDGIGALDLRVLAPTALPR